MTNETDLPGVYTVSFTVPAASERGIRTATGQDAASGVTVDALRATPAATKLVVTTPNDPPAGAEPADHVTLYSTDEFVLRTDTGELLKLERAEGEPVDETAALTGTPPTSMPCRRTPPASPSPSCAAARLLQASRCRFRKRRSEYELYKSARR